MTNSRLRVLAFSLLIVGFLTTDTSAIDWHAFRNKAASGLRSVGTNLNTLKNKALDSNTYRKAWDVTKDKASTAKDMAEVAWITTRDAVREKSADAYSYAVDYSRRNHKALGIALGVTAVVAIGAIVYSIYKRSKTVVQPFGVPVQPPVSVTVQQ